MVEVQTACLPALPLFFAALDELERLSVSSLPRTEDGTPVDNLNTTETIMLMGVIPATIITVRPDTEFGFRCLSMGASNLGQDRWPTGGGDALGSEDTNRAQQIFAEWAGLLAEVPYTDEVRLPLDAALRRAQDAWAAVVPGPAVLVPADFENTCPDPGWAQLGASLSRLAWANRVMHALNGHGKSWEPSVTISITTVAGGVRARLRLHSYQFSGELDRLTRSRHTTLQQWADAISRCSAEMWSAVGISALDPECDDLPEKLREALMVPLEPDQLAKTAIDQWDDNTWWATSDPQWAKTTRALTALTASLPAGSKMELELGPQIWSLEVDGYQLGMRRGEPVPYATGSDCSSLLRAVVRATVTTREA